MKTEEEKCNFYDNKKIYKFIWHVNFGFEI